MEECKQAKHKNDGSQPAITAVRFIGVFLYLSLAQIPWALSPTEL
jgi:hypothetical protein